MTHRRLTRPLAFTLGALLLAGCGSQAPVQLDVAPAATTDELAPAAEETVTSEVKVAPAETESSEQPEADEAETVEPVSDEPEPAAETSAPPSPSSSSSSPSSSSSSSSSPTPDPELVVDEDGCATDVATGIVVACHDPAAGPDDD